MPVLNRENKTSPAKPVPVDLNQAPAITQLNSKGAPGQEAHGMPDLYRHVDTTSSSPLPPMPAKDQAAWTEEESTESSDDHYIEPPVPPWRRYRSHVQGQASFASAPYRTIGPPSSWHIPNPRPMTSQHSQYYHYHQPSRATYPEPDIRHADDESNSPSTEAERREELWTKVDSQRRKVDDLRAEMLKKRREVQAFRRKKDAVDNAFMQIIRPHLTSTKRVAMIPTEVLKERFDEMQSVRNDYYALESAYEALEKEVDTEELQLQALEGGLYRMLLARSSAHRSTTSSDWSEDEEDHDDDVSTSSSESRVSLLGITGDRQEDIHPLYQELLDAIGDRNLHREHHDEIRVHRDKILYDLEMRIHLQRTKNRSSALTEEELAELKSAVEQASTDPEELRMLLGVTIGEDELEFLKDYRTEEVEVRQKLEVTSQKVDRLRALCTEKGLMRKHPSYNEEYAIFSGTNQSFVLAEGNISIETQSKADGDLSHPKFPILLSNPSHVLDLLSPVAAVDRAMKMSKDNPAKQQQTAACMKELGITNLMKKADGKPDYINQWLIHRLRTSPMEAELLLSVCQGKFNVPNLRRWQEQVLYYWRKDEAANLSPFDFQGPKTPKDELDFDDGSDFRGNSVVEGSARARSEDGGAAPRSHHQRRDTPTRSVRSMT